MPTSSRFSIVTPSMTPAMHPAWLTGWPSCAPHPARSWCLILSIVWIVRMPVPSRSPMRRCLSSNGQPGSLMSCRVGMTLPVRETLSPLLQLTGWLQWRHRQYKRRSVSPIRPPSGLSARQPMRRPQPSPLRQRRWNWPPLPPRRRMPSSSSPKTLRWWRKMLPMRRVSQPIPYNKMPAAPRRSPPQLKRRQHKTPLQPRRRWHTLPAPTVLKRALNRPRRTLQRRPRPAPGRVPIRLPSKPPVPTIWRLV